MRKSLAALFLSCSLFALADFNSIVSEIETNNPDLAARRAAVLSETMARVAENRLEATEIEFSYLWPEHKEVGNKLDFSLSQSFDWPGAYGARRRAARSAAEANAAALKAGERDLRMRANEALFAIIDANCRCELLEHIVANLDSMHSAAHTMLDAGSITELDHRKVALEEISMKQQLTDARADRAAALAELAALNGGTLPDGALDLNTYPAQTLRPLEEYLAAEAPEVDAARLEAKTLRLDSRAERLGLFPGFSLGYNFENEGGDKFHGFSIGLTLPSYSAKPKARAAELMAESKSAEAESADLTRRSEITANHASAVRLTELMDEYKRALGTNYETLLLRSLQGGQISYADYFTELNFYLAAKLESLSRQQRLQTLLATLNSRL